MRVEALCVLPRAARVTFSECSEAQVNAVRRTLVSDLPTIAATHVHVYVNSSCFPDEYVAHRIGMLPLRGPLRKGTLRIDRAGPCRVLGRDLQLPCGDDAPATATAGVAASQAIEVMAPDSLVVELQAGECFHAEVQVDVGTGAEHARWCSAVAVRYAQRTTGFDGADARLGECFCDETPYGTGRCAHCGAPKRSAALAHAPVVFELAFETTGALTPSEMLVGAFEQVARDLRALGTACASAQSSI